MASLTNQKTTAASRPFGTVLVAGAPRLILRMEGAALLAGCVAGYAVLGGSWWVFAALFLLPDVFMLGYLLDSRRGAALYNLGHSTAVPGLVIAAGLLMRSDMATAAGLVWLAHVGFDRAVGYGLKYSDGFRHTHLG